MICAIRKSHLERHNSRSKDSHGKYHNSCEACAKNFCYKKDLLHHQAEFHDLHKCEDCGRIFVSLENKEIHCVDRVVSPCQMCDKTFCNSRSLARHRISVHECTDCELCGAKGIFLYNLKAHRKDVHQIEETFTCHECDSTFSSKSNLLKHIGSVHSTVEIKCGTCDKVFSRSDMLKRHEKQFHSETIPIFSCDHCSYQSPKMSNLDRHSKGRVKNFCDVCKEYFCKKGDLVLHTTIYHRKSKS